jgi:hypothetical protein
MGSHLLPPLSGRLICPSEPERTTSQDIIQIGSIMFPLEKVAKDRLFQTIRL